MNKKSQIIKFNNITKSLNPYNILATASFWPSILEKFINNVMKNGKKNVSELQLSFLIYYWKTQLKRDFYFDFILLLNYFIWPLLLLKVKKHGKPVELLGLLQVEQRWYNNLKQLLKQKSRFLLSSMLVKPNNSADSIFNFKHIKKTTYRNMRFIRYRW